MWHSRWPIQFPVKLWSKFFSGRVSPIESFAMISSNKLVSRPRLIASLKSFLNLFDKVSNYTKVESNIANLNIASNKGLGDMRSTLKEFLGMSSEIPKNVNELITTADALVRTGRTYKEALEITKETAKLSVATGEDLDSTAKTVTKVMVSLGIESKQVKDVLNILHSTAIQTASSMESISGGMNQVAGSLGAIAQSSGRSGEELAKYKKELLEVGAVGLGVMNNLGKSASRQFR